MISLSLGIRLRQKSALQTMLYDFHLACFPSQLSGLPSSFLFPIFQWMWTNWSLGQFFPSSTKQLWKSQPQLYFLLTQHLHWKVQIKAVLSPASSALLQFLPVKSAFSSCHSHSSQRLSVPFLAGMPRLGWVERQVRPWWYLASGHRSTWLSLIVNLLSSAEASTQPFLIFIISLFPCVGTPSRGDQRSSPLFLSPALAFQLKDGWFPCISQITCLPWGILLSYVSLLFFKLRMFFPYPQPFRACRGTLVIFATEMLPTLLKSCSKSRGWYNLRDFRVVKSWWDPFSQPLSSWL